MSHVIGPITFRGFLIKINTPVNEVQDLVQIDQKKNKVCLSVHQLYLHGHFYRSEKKFHGD